MQRRDFIKCGILLTVTCGIGCSVWQMNNNNTPVFSTDNIDYDFTNSKKPCIYPFMNLQIDYEGNVYPCCPTYLNHISCGNIFEEDLYSIWTGKKWQNLRKKMFKGDFSSCNRFECYYRPSDIKTFDASKNLPDIVLLTYDPECNYKCITCRDEIWQNSDEKLYKLNNEVIPRILPFISKVNTVNFSGGDPLASRHTRKLIKEVCKNNPVCKMAINTQGYFLDQKNMDELGIKELQWVSISIHAAKRKTYEKIMRQDSFNRIMQNLEFISEWKKQGKVHDIIINFVVHSMNYKEMPDFVRIAEKYDAQASFWSYHPWDTAEMHKRYKEVAVFEPYHKDYPKLKQILKDPIFNSKHCVLYPELLKIAKE